MQAAGDGDLLGVHSLGAMPSDLSTDHYGARMGDEEGER